jgi:hypothetical protein
VTLYEVQLVLAWVAIVAWSLVVVLLLTIILPTRKAPRGAGS